MLSPPLDLTCPPPLPPALSYLAPLVPQELYCSTYTEKYVSPTNLRPASWEATQYSSSVVEIFPCTKLIWPRMETHQNVYEVENEDDYNNCVTGSGGQDLTLGLMDPSVDDWDPNPPSDDSPNRSTNERKRLRCKS